MRKDGRGSRWLLGLGCQQEGALHTRGLRLAGEVAVEGRCMSRLYVRVARKIDLCEKTCYNSGAQPLRGAIEMEAVQRRVTVNDLMQQGYSYVLTEPMGQNFHADFRPELTPKQMFELGVFGGKYMTDCVAEYPGDWFENAKLCPERHDPRLNYFGVNASQPLSVWRAKGWIYHEDPRGWFQWYCRYYMGRRCPDDERQIQRWRAIRRHVAQVVKNCRPGDFECRRKQRQVLLHWAYDSRKI